MEAGYLRTRKWLKLPRWANDFLFLLADLVLGVGALWVLYPLLWPVLAQAQAQAPGPVPGSVFALLIPLLMIGAGLYGFNTWMGRTAWKQAVTSAWPALQWRVRHADSVRYIGDLPSAQAERLAEIRMAPGITRAEVWDCALLLQEEVPLVAFLERYSGFYTPKEATDTAMEALGGKLAAARSRVQQIQEQIRSTTTHAVATYAFFEIDITDEERAARAARCPWD